MKYKFRLILLVFVMFFISVNYVSAATGIVNVNDSLTLRKEASTSSGVITSFYNGTVLNISDTTIASGNGCDNNWYKVSYGSYTGYVCSTFVNLNSSLEDNSYIKGNYSNITSDGRIMCYEDTGDITLRNDANGGFTSHKIKCGEKVTILSSKETSGECKYWYQIKSGNKTGYVKGYFVNTTKLSTFAQNYYNNKTNGDTIDSYKARLTSLNFPSSYHNYLLEIHARHPSWNFVAEKINLNFGDVVNGESSYGRSLLQGSAFDKGYLSVAAHTFNPQTNTFTGYASEPGYYNASKEALAYFLDPRNYLNEKYIFAFETLGYSSNQTVSFINSILGSQSFWSTDRSNDLVRAASTAGVSALHIASRIKQEMNGLTSSDSRLGGGFTYNGNSYSGYYNYFNIKSSCKNCSSIYAGYAYEKGWNTPYLGLLGGANFLGKDYININQDTIYYQKFDVSTTNGHHAHEFQQNIAAPFQEGGISYKGLVNSLPSYLNTAITFVIPVYNDMPEYSVTAPSKGSPNNYLKSLKVNGTSVSNFSYATNNYNMTLESGTKSVNVTAEVIDANARVLGTGNINITSNEQTSTFEVISESGKSNKYTITFIRKDSTPQGITSIMNNSGFKYNSEYLFGINVGTNVSTLIGNIKEYDSSANVVIKSSNGTEKTNESFKTGDKATVKGTDGEKTYTIIIYGDNNGDGLIDRNDLLKLQRKVFGYTSLNGAFLEASDINKDRKVDRTDLLQLQRHAFGYSTIKQ